MVRWLLYLSVYALFLEGFDFHAQTRHQETEFILANGEKLSGPNLPVALEGHAMVRINSTNTLIIGKLIF